MYVQLSILFFLLLFPALSFARQQGGIPLVDTTHKFSPEPVKEALVVPSQALVRLDGDSKNSPEDISVPPLGDDLFRQQLTSRSAIVMDAQSGEIIYAHNPYRPAQPASTIKILTGLIAIKTLDDNDWVSASRRAAGMPRSKVYLRKGKSYRAGDLINAVLLSSANDASVALAEKISGSEKTFAKLMTRTARELGAKSTACRTATGLTAHGQYTTASDLAVLFREAMDNSEFAARIARIKVRTGYGKLLRNHNRALWQVDGAEGGKTGYTRAARQTYVGKFKRGDDELVVAVLGSETMWDDIKRLVEYGFAKSNGAGSHRTADNRRQLPAPVGVSPNPYALTVLSERYKLSSL